MGESKLTDEQVIQMVSIIAGKYGGKLEEMDFEKHTIKVECPEESKSAIAIEVAEVMQNIFE